MPQYTLSESAINLAKKDENLFQKIKDAISTIAYQKINESAISATIDTSFLQPNHVLTETEVTNLLRYFVPIYLSDIAAYLPELGSKITYSNDTLVQIANIVRTAIIYQGYLNLVDDNGLKINDNGVNREITLEDVISTVNLMLQNTEFLRRLKSHIRV